MVARFTVLGCGRSKLVFVLSFSDINLSVSIS